MGKPKSWPKYQMILVKVQMRRRRRSSGVLLHVTSLPSKFGVGDLGPQAYDFVNRLADSGQTYWQILPLTPTDARSGNSPYNSNSLFAGNFVLISPELLAKDGMIDTDLVKELSYHTASRVNYEAIAALKHRLIEKSYTKFKENKVQSFEFEDFCSENSYWLDDYSLYKAISREIGTPWHLWPLSLRDREDQALEDKGRSISDLIEFEKFIQFVFFKQWGLLRAYCRAKGLKIIGDLPFYVNHDSADVWANSETFKLDANKKPRFVGGVPPDYFSATGQLWGNPVYDWTQLSTTKFELLFQRMEHYLRLYDIVRLDHFRGFLAYWEVPAREKTAVNGKWVQTTSEEFFDALQKRFPTLPFIAEDLGVITPDVREVMDKLEIPGMQVLLFAFSGSSDNYHLPHNYKQNSAVYTGTHDTNTAKGWFMDEANHSEKTMLFRYVGRELSEKDVSWEMIKLAMMSSSDECIIPVQDILSLGAEARMNNPAKPANNWEWKLTTTQLAIDNFTKLGELTAASSRT